MPLSWPSLTCGCCFLVSAGTVTASNWAQVSGARSQNAGFSPKTGWNPRFGHALAAIEYTEEDEVLNRVQSRLFVLGGDDWNGKVCPNPGANGCGLQNDVWYTTGVDFSTWYNVFEKKPTILSRTEWVQPNIGKTPPTGVSYDDWIQCAMQRWTPVQQLGCDDALNPPGSYIPDLMWSPRRNHAAVGWNQKLWVLGGRSREMKNITVDFDFRDNFGHLTASPTPAPRDDGIQGNDAEFAAREKLFPYKWREEISMKNDIWYSEDAGSSWNLLNPGCPYPRKENVQKRGVARSACLSTADCIGDAICDAGLRACVCDMWDAREGHAVVVHNNRLFVSGGFVELRLQSCGGAREHSPLVDAISPVDDPNSCGGRYRGYMNDVWMSSEDGRDWRAITLSADWRGRGEHAMISIMDSLYVFGGQGGNPWNINDAPLFNDVWSIGISENGEQTSWVDHGQGGWEARSRHTVVYDGEKVILIGGQLEDTLSNQVWTWVPGGNEEWQMDFNLSHVPTGTYISPNSPLEQLHLLDEDQITILYGYFIFTVADMAHASQQQILELRYESGLFKDVCIYKKLAEFILEECTVQSSKHHAANKYGPAERTAQNPYGIKFRNEDGSDDVDQQGNPFVTLKVSADNRIPEDRGSLSAPSDWDGCTRLFGDENIELLVPGHTGLVPQNTHHMKWGIPGTPYSSFPFVCKWTFDPVADHASIFFKGDVLTLGGRYGQGDLFSDEVWKRDRDLPISNLFKRPTSGTSETRFVFECNELGKVDPLDFDPEARGELNCVFEYKLEALKFGRQARITLVDWTLVHYAVDLSLDILQEGSFILSVRAIDSAGNKEIRFERGRNEYEWVHEPDIDWVLILSVIAAFLFMCGLIHLEIRRRRRKAAQERYAIKRMRRKFKGIKKDAAAKDVDWRAYYEESKKDGKVKRDKPAGDGKNVRSRAAPRA